MHTDYVSIYGNICIEGILNSEVLLKFIYIMKAILSVLLFSLITISSFSQVIGGSAYEKAFDLIYGDDECLYLTGFTSSYGNGSRDGFIVKYNCVNGLYSYNTWGRTDYDEFRSIVKTNDGFLLSGFSFWNDELSIQAIMVKINSQLNIEWARNFGNGQFQHAYACLELADGSLIAAGVDRSVGYYGPFVIKTDPNGNTIWEKTYSDYQPVHVTDICEKPNGNIILLCNKGGFFNLGTNWHSSFSSNADIFFLELNSNGDVVTEKTIEAPRHDIPSSLMADGNGNYYVLSHSQSYSSGKSFDICLFFFNSSYELQWVKTFGGDDFEYAADFKRDSYGNIHIVGTSASENENYPVLFYIKTDANGELLDSRNLITEYRCYGASVEVVGDNIYLLGTITKDGSDSFVLLENFKINNETVFFPVVYAYPNPVIGECNIFINNPNLHTENVKIEIINSAGSVIDILFTDLSPLNPELKLDFSSYDAGNYFVKISNDKVYQIIQIVVVK